MGQKGQISFINDLDLFRNMIEIPRLMLLWHYPVHSDQGIVERVEPTFRRSFPPIPEGWEPTYPDMSDSKPQEPTYSHIQERKLKRPYSDKLDSKPQEHTHSDIRDDKYRNPMDKNIDPDFFPQITKQETHYPPLPLEPEKIRSLNVHQEFGSSVAVTPEGGVHSHMRRSVTVISQIYSKAIGILPKSGVNAGHTADLAGLELHLEGIAQKFYVQPMSGGTRVRFEPGDEVVLYSTPDASLRNVLGFQILDDQGVRFAHILPSKTHYNWET